MKPKPENVQDLLAPNVVIRRKNKLIHLHLPQRIQVIHIIIDICIRVVEKVDIEVEVGIGTDILQINIVEVQ